MNNEPDYVQVAPAEIHVREPFSKIFRIKEGMRKTIANSMRVNGYDMAQPIVVWRQENIVVDGHTRRQAAIDAGIEVFACFCDFKDEDEAFDYAVARQRDRRNLTPDELLSLVAAIRKRKLRGGDRHSRSFKASDEALKGKEATAVADIIGVSTSTVERALTVLNRAEKGDSQEMDAVIEGTMSLDKAAVKARAKNKEDEKTLYMIVADLLVSLEYNAKNAPRKEKDREAFIAKYGLLDGTLKKRFSNGTLQRAYIHLGWEKAPRKKSLRERDKKAYGSATITNGVAPSLQVRLMDRPIEATDEAWLDSLKVRATVHVKRRFDDDALIVRHCKPLIQEIKQEIEKRLGLRSETGMTPLHRALHRVFDIQNPEIWQTCIKCEGSGLDNGRCRGCGGLGYLIPGFTKEMK